jgi:ferric-dicitrate binding protein FerR (iron transport regulator)
MRCEDIEDLLNEHADVALTPAQRREVDAHLAACDDCSTAWHAAGTLRRHGALPTPVPSAALIEKLAATRQPIGVKKRMSPWAAAIGGALAAGIALVAFDYYRAGADDRAPAVPSVTMSLNETRDVSVSIDSPQAFMDVEVRVLLAGGIEIEGLRGRRELKWKTDLEAGINRLTLPIVASDSSGGKILVAVGHGDTQRAFVVQIDVDGAAADTEI